MSDKEIANISTVESTQMSVDAVSNQVKHIQEVMERVMKKDEHYGTIPGTNKPTLLKPGAEKLCLTFRLDPDYEIIEKVREECFIAYTVKCILRHINSGNIIASGIGSCNSRETKYRYRWESTGRPVPQDYWKHRDPALLGGTEFRTVKIDSSWFIAERTENLEPWDLDNTLIKMACKRALVAATLNATAASDIFTQDLEDAIDSTPHGTVAPKSNGKKDKVEPDSPAGTTVEDAAKVRNDQNATTQAKMNQYSELIKDLQKLKIKPASKMTAIVSEAISMGENWDAKIEFLQGKIMEYWEKSGGENATE